MYPTKTEAPLRRSGLRVAAPLLLSASLFLSLLTLFMVGASPALAAKSDPAPALPLSEEVFYGAGDVQLPLNENQLLEFLRTAPITEVKVLATGINGTQKITLEDRGLKAHAVFRTVEEKVDDSVGTRPNRFGFRDSYVFEVAAYRLSRMLGIHRVPPAVFREIDGKHGSVQLWIENARTAADAIRDGLAREEPVLRHLQRQLMYGFDQLVYNFDRHHGNILYDSRNRLWFIDHTRSFKRLPQLSKDQMPSLADRQFLGALRSLDPAVIRTQMKDILTKIEIDALMRRRALLLRHFDTLIEEHGRDKVVMDLTRARQAEPVTAVATGPASSSMRARIL